MDDIVFLDIGARVVRCVENRYGRLTECVAVIAVIAALLALAAVLIGWIVG